MMRDRTTERCSAPWRVVLLTVGTLCLATGLIAIVVPLLPTTPFLLLSAACYARGSQRIYRWLISSPYIGRYVRDYHEGRGMTRRARAFTLILLWSGIVASAVLFVGPLWLDIGLLIIAILVSVHIITVRPRKTGSYEEGVRHADRL